METLEAQGAISVDNNLNKIMPLSNKGTGEAEISQENKKSPVASLFDLVRSLITDNPLVCALKIFRSEFPGPEDTVRIQGTIVLSRKSVLDLVNPLAAIIDNEFDSLFARLVVLQLVSVDAKPDRQPKLSKKTSIHRWTTGKTLKRRLVAGDEYYSVTFYVPKDFGEVGAFVIRNNHPYEFYLHDVTLVSDTGHSCEFPCYSWVYNYTIYGKDRVFFTNKTYLPGQTPTGLRNYREHELEELRGDGEGVRLAHDRIYDYATYNDIGISDLGALRPPLGGSEEFPYPRRCRTGRRPGIADLKSESTIGVGSLQFYVPADEYFEREKNSGFYASAVKGFGHAVAPIIRGLFDDTPNTWNSLEELKGLYTKGLDLESEMRKKVNRNNLVFLKTIFVAEGDDKSIIKYPLPDILKRNEDGWMHDEEFGRQTLAGLNPVVIEAVTEFPPKSFLDPEEYGEATALTEEHIEPYLEGLSVQEAIEAKRLFKVDYRDFLMLYIGEVNKTSYKAYAPRSYFFWTSRGTMKPVAIELSLPPSEDGPGSNRVFTPPQKKEDNSLYWNLAKVHASCVDFGVHELVSHWLRSHAVIEPFIIATHRNLSKLHPVCTLLLPMFRNTMKMNAAARQFIICALGVIELTFFTGEFGLQITSKAYGASWRFDHEALPANLIARGMAEPADSSEPGGVKLVVDDYPFAKDGLDFWDAIQTYVNEYLNVVYKGSDQAIQDDPELQEWWNESIQVGHGDKKDESWWPKADSIESLTHIITTIAWIAGPYHAAVNFGHYSYAGFMPNRPPHCRRLIPEPGSEEEQRLLEDPERWLMQTLSSKAATSVVLAVLELLASHSVDEEYQGRRLNDNWSSDPELKVVFSKFSRKMEELQGKFEERNSNPELLNREAGPTKLPYTLLYPHSEESGLTGRGVPYSASI
ncbi:hypothetical protein R1sor_026592 [Riccia sorocarpa]|uniref:Lipoxygenase n=1 Tax=Riccia sorocarpa TaxID=122646 RepID=A0ABD3GFX2_9MARC